MPSKFRKHRFYTVTGQCNQDIDTLIIPEGTTENSYGTFRGLNIRKVIIPDGFVELAGDTFMDCKKLQDVQIPKTLRSIGALAFANCNALKQLYVPDSVTHLDAMTLDETLVIYGKIGSAAHVYAKKLGAAFVESHT